MIEVKNLVKTYDKVKAVNDISLRAENGEVTILLGPNGAGKSTTIKSIAGLLSHQGKISIDGYENTSIEAKRIFGYTPETPIFYEALTIEEHIHYVGKAYRIPDYMAYADELLERFHLSEKKKTIAKELSKGMTQKLSLMLALLPRPTSLLIDEPMIGLDPSAIEEVLNILRDLRSQSVSILISTHIIDVINGIWDCAYIMDKGVIKRYVRKEELLASDQTLKEVFFSCIEEAL